jgi:glyoxylase-like metal-dependent hydrolase (beta-lactamase superfamily II)
MSTVHSYLVRGTDGHLLVDTGWDTEKCWRAFRDELDAMDVDVASIENVLVTHSHPDHMGLAERLRQRIDVTVLAHSYDTQPQTPLFTHLREHVPYLNDWLKYNGVPAEQIKEMNDLERSSHPKPYISRLEIDEWAGPETTFHIDGNRWEVVWTPGHTPGHLCLFEPDSGILLSGDHVLPDETPNVSHRPDLPHSSLSSYIDSLERTTDFDVQLALPAHGGPVEDARGRIDEILNHHEHRLQETLDILADGPTTGWEAAHEINWSLGEFRGFVPGNQNLALLEALAHLEHLKCTGDVRLGLDSGLMNYRLA